MLLFPFVSAAILAKAWSWLLLPASVAVMAAFLAREPLTVLARQRWVWTQERPEAAAARWTLWRVAPVLAAAGLALLGRVPLPWLAALGALGATLTAVAIYAALHKLQRSTLLQLAGAFGLTSAGALAWLACGRTPDWTLGMLVLIHTVHATAGVLVVHARLEALQNRKAAQPKSQARSTAWVWQAVQAAVTVWLAAEGERGLAAALALPLVLHAAALMRLGTESSLNTPLRRVGFQALSLSAVMSVIVVVALW